LWRHRTIAPTWFQRFIHVSFGNTGNPQPPTPQSPGTMTDTGFTVSDLTPLLTWTGAANASRYGLYVSREPYGQVNLVHSDTNVTGLSTNIPAGKLQNDTKYRWNMTSFGSNGVESGVSTTLYFKTPATQTTAGFGGTVTDAQSGAPVSGASVVWGSYSTTTNGAGGYAFSGLQCTGTNLVVSKNGYQTSTELYQPPCQPNNVKNVTLQPVVVDTLHQQISDYADQLSLQHKVPSVLIKAVIEVESQWITTADHDEGGGIHGIGLMQVTVNTNAATASLSLGQIDTTHPQGQNGFTTTAANVSVDVPRLKTDWQYNLETGVRILVAKKVASGGAGDDASILENWYYPLAYFNGVIKYSGQASYATSPGPYNDPAFSYSRSGNWRSKSNFPYQECVYNVIAQLDGTVPADIRSLMGTPIKVTLPGPSAVGSGAGQYAYLEPVFCFYDWALYTADGVARVGNGGGKNNGCIATYNVHANVAFHSVPFGPPSGGVVKTPPTVTTVGASGVGTTSLTFNASVNPNGRATSAWFEYGPTATYGSTTITTPLGSGSSATPANIGVSGLSSGTLYHFRAVASNADGVATGDDAIVTTSASPQPSVITDAADGVTSSTATLHGQANPNGTATSGFFAYGTAPNPGTATGAQQIGSGNTLVPFTTTLTGLACGTTYYFHAIASSAQGAPNGLDRTFTTSSCAGPAVTTLAASSIGQTSATLNGNVNPNGTATTASFLYGPSIGYGASTAGQDLGAGASSVSFSAGIGGLTCGTQYHFAAQASSVAGTPAGSDVTFTTAPCATPPPSGGEYVADADTVLLLHLNEGSGSSLADASAAGNSGSASGTTATPAVYGNGRRFSNVVTDLATDFVSLGNSSSLNPAALTFEAWINLTTSSQGVPTGIPVFGREDSWAGNIAYILEILSAPAGTQCGGTDVLHIYDGDISLCSSVGVPLNRWTHVAFTMQAQSGFKTAQLFINGQLAGQQTVSGPFHANNLTTYLGRRWGNMGGAPYNHGFDGLIDEVRVSSKVRLPSELHLGPSRADADGDGNPDIYWRSYATGANAVWTMIGTNFSSIVNLPALPNTAYRIEGVGDFNGDGQPDILWRNGSSGANALWLMNGANVSSIVNLPGLAGANFHFEGVADMDGDGDPDILIRNYANGNNALWIMNGVNFSSIVNLPALANPDYHIEAAADFNGDGKPDIVWRNYTTGANALWLMNGTSYVDTINLQALPNSSYHIEGVADYNKDGHNDIVWRSYTTGANALWLLDANYNNAIVNLPALPDTNYELSGPR
ncbi:MAG: hypothetical protein JWO56_1702, partial [Acidobacteria bacterium]|nr:hypothetical protein [Acidobacteriota bacterium]